MQNNGFITNFWSKEEAKKNVWFMINLDAPDQLRQRVAWALAQVSKGIIYFYFMMIVSH